MAAPDIDRTTDERLVDDQRRVEAVKRLRAKRDLGSHLVAYVTVNVFLWVLWLVLGASSFPWPLWVTLGWGIGVVMNVWEVYGRRPITEADIRREMERETSGR